MCTVPGRNELVTTATKIPRPSPLPSNLPDSVDPMLPPQSGIAEMRITPSQWPEKRFIILPKQSLLRQFGYELYSCTGNACDTHRVIPEWEHDNHRIRCEIISGDTLLAKAVEPDSSEWLVTFAHKRSGRNIYGKTHDGAIKDLVAAEDLEGARRRWRGRVVFSRRGVITTIDTVSASFASLRVSLQDSLKVIDVRPGMTPLPVKPIWIMVVTSNGKRGFLPVNYSWTNVPTRRIAGKTPWEDDIFEQNPLTLYDWDETTWELLNNHRVVLEMTTDQVSLSWGRPVSVIRSTDPDMETWIYPSHELSFEKKRLNGIRERGPNAPSP